MNLNRQWATTSAVNTPPKTPREVKALPNSLQAEHKQLAAAVTEIESKAVPRPTGAPSFEALKREHSYPGAGSLLRETGLQDTELLVNGVNTDFDKIAAKIITKAGEVTNPQFLESYAELFLRLAKILRSNVDAVKAERQQRTAYEIYRDELQTAHAQLQSFQERIAGMSDHEIQTIKHAEELQQLRDEYDQRFKALEATSRK